MNYIGIIGTRRRDGMEDFAKVAAAFHQIYKPGDVVVSGGCKQGGDRFAEILASYTPDEPIIFLPDKRLLNQELIEAGKIRQAWAIINYARNTKIAEKSTILIACVAPDRKGGTEDTIKKFKKFHPDGLLILVE